MAERGKASFGLALFAVLLVSSCTRKQTVVHQDAASLAAIAGTYGQGSHPAELASFKPVAEIQTPPVSDAGDTEGQYSNQIAAYLVEKNYDALDQAAREDRTKKTRFKGGVWKLYMFYDALDKPTLGADATDEDWTYHIGRLKDWIAARPESVSARVALAQTYQIYANQARGGGYANTVSDTGWKLYRERVELAASTLSEAAKLKEKCPHWYEVMQNVALAQGWDKAQARKLFDDATAFEPTYYHFYREYANYLLPKWYGQPGESEAFAEEISNKVGGKEGKFIYFEIATLVTCQCDSDASNIENFSWPKIKEGYAALGELYGYSNLKLNRFAHMAFEANDKAAAQQAFSMIGNDWDHSVWRSGRKFEDAKNWAQGQ
ncbi:MAG TPA: DUF4034 domain-containing protein [Candidatus Limnocylindria bacterium]|nr:DUF4034 domain-containing protein [Candidatus Limnocylindria bacterium]